MKKVLFIATFCLALTTVKAQIGDKKNNVKVNLFSPLVRTGSFFYERKLSKNTSGQLGFFYTGFTSDGLKLRGFGITPEFRYYVSENKGALSGFYLAPFARYQNFTLSEGVNKGTLNTMGGGLLIGNQWVFKGGINLDLFIGPSVTTGKIKVTDGQDSFDLPFGINGFGVRSGLTIGIAF
jgi:hypothetical protein